MFRIKSDELNASYRWAFIGLALLSTAALIGSVWVLFDFFHEQEILADMMRKLPGEVKDSAKMLAGELRWQFRLSMIVLLNLIVTGIAIVMLWRAYRTSQVSLRDFKVLSADILGSLEQVVITTNRAGVVTSINRRGVELFETDNESIGKHISKVATTIPLEDFRQKWQADPSLDMIDDYKIDVHGNTRTFRVFCQNLTDFEGNHSGNVLQLRDVTERVLIEERMRRMERYMALTSLAAGLHHEIRNPLAALSLHVQLIEEQLDESVAKPEIIEMLKVVKSEVSRIGLVLEGFRDFASVSKLNLTEVNLEELVRTQLQLIGPKARQQKIKIRFDHFGKSSEKVMADPVRLEQVLLNLFINAMDAMPKGGELLVELLWQENRVRVLVSDTGIGIPEDLRDKIFDPYFTTKGEGTGLGLSLCDKIVRQHQGSLEFESKPGCTKFCITLQIGDNE